MSKTAFSAACTEWKDRISEQRTSGLTIKQWCKERQISTQQFYYWKKRVVESGLERRSFIELAEGRKEGIIIECGNLKIRLEKGFDITTLRDCLSVLGKITC